MFNYKYFYLDILVLYSIINIKIIYVKINCMSNVKFVNSVFVFNKKK